MAKQGDKARPAFTETLRVIDDSNLDVYEFRLLVHIWRVGVSWESARTLASKCNISIGKVSQVKKALVEKGYLVHKERGGRVGLAVADRSPREQTQQLNSSNCSSLEQECSPHARGVHHMNAILNEPYKLTNEDYASSAQTSLSPAPTDPLAALKEHFIRKTTIFPNERTGQHEREWAEPLRHLLVLSGNDLETACAMMDECLQRARTPKRDGSMYTVRSPKSLHTFAVNLAVERDAHATRLDADSLWQQAIQAITRHEYPDERLKAAIRAIGGTCRITAASEQDTDRLKQQLATAYRQPTAPAG